MEKLIIDGIFYGEITVHKKWLKFYNFTVKFTELKMGEISSLGIPNCIFLIKIED